MIWKQLLKDKPQRIDIYKCLVLKYHKRWVVEYLQWTSKGFQPLDYGQHGSHELDMDVAYWFDVEQIAPPIEEADKLIIEVKFYFGGEELLKYLSEKQIPIYEKYGNGVNVIISKIDEITLQELNSRFESNPSLFKTKK
jgi:hypothetical protein